MAFLFVLFFWDSYDSNVGAFNIVPEVSEIVLISLNSFFFSPLWFIYFYHFCSTSLILSSASIILLLVPSRVFFISFFALFIIYWLFFISSRSLLNIYFIFLILVSRLFICNSIFFSRFWIIFTMIIRNSLSGRFPISSSFVWFGGHLSCSFTCWVFSAFSSCLYCCVWGGLSVFWQFVVPLYYGVSSLLVGLDWCLVNVSWLGKLVPVFR